MHRPILEETQILSATLALLAGMLLLLLGVGWVLAGVEGSFLALLAAGSVLLLSPLVRWKKHRPRSFGRIIPPSEAPRISSAIQELSRRAGLANPPQLVYVDTQQVNAFAVRNPRYPAVGITRGLLNSLSFREITAVLAHEISHIRPREMRVMTLAQVLESAVVTFSLLGAVLFLIQVPSLDFIQATALVPELLFLLAAPFGGAGLQLAIQRQSEYSADLTAVRLAGDPIGLASALRKLETGRCRFLKIFFPGLFREPSPLLQTHPRTQTRIERLLQLGRKDQLKTAL